MVENKRETIIYVVMAYLISWASWGTMALLGLGVNDSTVSVILYVLGGLSATIPAFIIPFLAKKGERKAYFKRYFKVGIHVRWYIIPIAAVILMICIPYGIELVFFKKAAESLAIQPLYMVIPYFAKMVIGGGIEEFGWRGIMVHNLKRVNPLLVSLIVGFIWICWHIPLFFIKDTLQYHADFLSFAVFMFGLNLMTNILYLKTESVIPCIIFHAGFNALGNLGFWYGNCEFTANITNSLSVLVIAAVFFAVLSGKRLPKQIRRSRILPRVT